MDLNVSDDAFCDRHVSHLALAAYLEVAEPKIIAARIAFHLPSLRELGEVKHIEHAPEDGGDSWIEYFLRGAHVIYMLLVSEEPKACDFTVLAIRGLNLINKGAYGVDAMGELRRLNRRFGLSDESFL